MVGHNPPGADERGGEGTRPAACEDLQGLASRWRSESLNTTALSHYAHVQEMHSNVEVGTYIPQQSPRIPIWVVGDPKQSQLQRAARWDGAVIGGSPEELLVRKAAIEGLRTSSVPLDSRTRWKEN